MRGVNKYCCRENYHGGCFFVKKNPGFAGDEGQLNSARMIITQS